MKKLWIVLFLCALLTLTTLANEFGYYDTDLDGKVDLKDALAQLNTLLNGDADFSLLHIIQTIKAATASEAVDATVIGVDTAERTVTFSTTHADGVTVPFSALGIETADAAALDSTTAILSLQKPVTSSSAVYAARMGARLSVPAGTNDRPLSIKALNTESANGSHAEDDFHTASVEVNYRETLDFTKEDHHRYRLAFYPRVKKVKDDLYLMVYHVNELGAHVYYVTSEDGIHWNDPELIYNNREAYAIVPTYTDGPLKGKSDDKFVAVNPDACVLNNGEILYVYAIRPAAGYHDYPDLSGLFLIRGTVGADNTITWSAAEQITYGQVWEPFIWQREDGQVEIYWSNPAPYMSRYGYDYNVRSVGVSMIASNDNGHTWSPNKEEGKAGGYLYNRVYNEYIGDSYGKNADGGPLHATALPYFGGQMPAVTRLYDGRSLLAAEVRQLNQTFDFSFAVSKAGGEWETLDLTENGPENAHRSIFDAAGPYLATFPSGEVYLTYHWSGKQYYKMGDPKGTGFTEERYIAVPGAGGMWGSSELVGSHEVITAGQLKTKVVSTDAETSEDAVTYEYGIELVHSYLNHRTNAQKFAILTDGYTNDWANNTDALFVGSESQAQLSVQTAHDKDNVYFLLSRFDEVLTSGDNVILHVGDCVVTVLLDGSYTVGSVSGKGAAKLHGSIDDNTDTDEGVLIELAIPKTALGLATADSFRFAPVLTNADGSDAITDTLTQITLDTTDRWPVVVLD